MALLVLSLLTISSTATQQSAHKSSTVSPLDTKNLDFSLNNEPLLVGVRMLNRENLGLSFGFEKPLAHKVSDPEIPSRKVTISLKDPTTREVLDLSPSYSSGF